MTTRRRAPLLLLALLAACPSTAPSEKTTLGTPRPELHRFALEVDPAAITQVELVGDITPRPRPLRETRPGLWETSVALPAKGALRYQFRVQYRDGSWRRVSDPRAWQLDASHQRNSVIVPGTSPPPRPRRLNSMPAFGDLVIYELSLREMVDPGTPYADQTSTPSAKAPLLGDIFARVKARIESGYFERLGVNAIELMPVLAQGWVRDKKTKELKRPPWGYQALSWYALNGDFGSAADFTALVDAAHARGLAVILDFSLEHGYGGKENGLITDLFPSWREAKPKNPWGLLELSLQRAQTRAFLVGALKRLLVDLGADGIRFDWTEKVSTPIWKEVIDQVRRFKPEAILISENPRLALLQQAGFDGVWDFFFQWEAPLLLREVYRNWDGFSKRLVSTQAKLVENLLGAAYPPHGAKAIAGFDTRKPPRVVRYIESHDLTRIARKRVRLKHGGDHLLDVNGDGKTPDWLDKGSLRKSRLGATLLATLPGAIMIFSGQEHGAADALTWAYDPIDEAKADGPTLAHYRKLLRLRARRPELRSNDLRLLFSDEERHLLAYSRGTDSSRADDDRAVVVLNFGPGPQKGVLLRLPSKGVWKDAISGARHTGEKVRLDLAHAGSALLLRGDT